MSERERLAYLIAVDEATADLPTAAFLIELARHGQFSPTPRGPR